MDTVEKTASTVIIGVLAITLKGQILPALIKGLSFREALIKLDRKPGNERYWMFLGTD